MYQLADGDNWRQNIIWYQSSALASQFDDSASNEPISVR